MVVMGRPNVQSSPKLCNRNVAQSQCSHRFRTSKNVYSRICDKRRRWKNNFCSFWGTNDLRKESKEIDPFQWDGADLVTLASVLVFSLFLDGKTVRRLFDRQQVKMNESFTTFVFCFLMFCLYNGPTDRTQLTKKARVLNPRVIADNFSVSFEMKTFYSSKEETLKNVNERWTIFTNIQRKFNDDSTMINETNLVEWKRNIFFLLWREWSLWGQHWKTKS